MSSSQIRQQIVIDAVNNTGRAFNAVNSNLNRVSNEADRVNQFLSRMQAHFLGLVGFNVGVDLVRSMSTMSDRAIELDAKMRLVSETNEDAADSFKQLTEISLRSGTALDDNATLFTRINKPIRAMGYAMQDAVDITEILALSMRISGASFQEGASTTLQFSQAMASGVLRGEEFNSLMENSPRVIETLTDSLEVTTGTLRQMAHDGLLTSEVVVKSMLEQAEAIRIESAKLPLTISRSIINIKTEMLVFMGTMNETNTSIANVFNGIAQNLDLILDAAKVLGAVLLAISTKYILGKTKEYVSTTRLVGLEATRAANLARGGAAESSRNAQWQLNISNRLVRERELAIVQTNADRERLLAARQLLILQREADIAELRAIINTNASTFSHAEKNAMLQRRFAIQQSLIAQDRVLNAASANLARNSDSLRESTQGLNSARVESNRNTRSASDALRELNDRQDEASRSANTLGSRVGSLATNAAAFAGGAALWGYIAYEVSKGLLEMAVGSDQAAIEIDSGMIRMKLSIVRFVAGADLLLSIFKATLLSTVAAIPIVGEQLTGGFDKIYDDLAASYATYKGIIGEIDKDQDAQINELYRKSALAKLGFNSEEERHAKAIQTAKRTDIQQIASITKAETKLAELRGKSRVIEKEGTKAQAELVNNIAQAKLTQLDVEIERHRTHGEELKGLKTNELAGYINTLGERHDILEDAIKESTDVWKKYYARKLKTAKKGSADEAKLIAESLSKTRKLYNDRVKYQTTQIGKLSKLRGKAYKDIEKSELNIRDIIRSSQEFIRSQNTATITATITATEASHKTNTRLLEISGKASRANALDLKTDGKVITQIRSDAKADLEALITSESKRSKSNKLSTSERLDAEFNINLAMNTYKTLITNTVRDERTLIKQRAKEAIELSKQIKKRVSSVEKYTKAIGELDSRIAKVRVAIVELDTKKLKLQIKAAEKALDKLVRRRTASVLVNIEEGTTPVYKDPIKAIRANHVDGLDTGVPKGYNTGGSTNNSPYVKRSDKVDGHGHGDNVHALLERGEFIMRKSVVDALGDPYFNAINNGVAPELATSLIGAPSTTTNKILNEPEDSPVIRRSSGGTVDDTVVPAKRDVRALRKEKPRRKDIFDRREEANTGTPLSYSTANWKDEYRAALSDISDVDTSEFLPRDIRIIESSIRDAENALSNIKDGLPIGLWSNVISNYSKSLTRVTTDISTAELNKEKNDAALDRADTLAEAEEDRIEAEEDRIEALIESREVAETQRQKSLQIQETRDDAKLEKEGYESQVKFNEIKAIQEFNGDTSITGDTRKRADAGWLKRQDDKAARANAFDGSGERLTGNALKKYEWENEQSQSRSKLEAELKRLNRESELKETDTNRADELLKSTISDGNSTAGELSRLRNNANKLAANQRKADIKANKAQALLAELDLIESFGGDTSITGDTRKRADAGWLKRQDDKAKNLRGAVNTPTPDTPDYEIPSGSFANPAWLKEQANKATRATRAKAIGANEGYEGYEGYGSETYKSAPDYEIASGSFANPAWLKEQANKAIRVEANKGKTYESVSDGHARVAAIQQEPNPSNPAWLKDQANKAMISNRAKAITADRIRRANQGVDSEESNQGYGSETYKSAPEASLSSSFINPAWLKEEEIKANKARGIRAVVPTPTPTPTPTSTSTSTPNKPEGMSDSGVNSMKENALLAALDARIKAASKITFDRVSSAAEVAYNRVKDVTKVNYGAPVTELTTAMSTAFKGNSTAETADNYGKGVSVTINLDNKSITGTFEQTPELDSILSTLSNQQRVT